MVAQRKQIIETKQNDEDAKSNNSDDNDEEQVEKGDVDISVDKSKDEIAHQSYTDEENEVAYEQIETTLNKDFEEDNVSKSNESSENDKINKSNKITEKMMKRSRKTFKGQPGIQILVNMLLDQMLKKNMKLLDPIKLAKKIMILKMDQKMGDIVMKIQRQIKSITLLMIEKISQI